MRFFAGILQSMRPAQWIKNGFLLAAPIFAQRIFHLPDLLRSLGALGLFCLLSGSVYLWNDIVDRNKDQAHPEKRLRPIAAGEVSITAAASFAIVLALASLLLAFRLQALFGWICLAYLVNNLLYSHFLKRLVILDVISIASGFVLRAVAGAEAVTVQISSWLVLCTFLLALFLGFSKRRHEMLLLVGDAALHRKSLEEYTPQFLDMMIAVVTASTVLSYALYTVSEETVLKFSTRNLIYTTLFVLYGLFRYLFLVYCRQEGGNPTRVLFKDAPLQLTMLLWLACCTWIIYGG